VDEALDDAGISKEVLGWTTINIVGPSNTNRPGVLAYLAGLVSSYGGNILRTVNNTFSDSSFTLRWVIQGLDNERKQALLKAFLDCEIKLSKVEIV
jgi:predicted amino acid-binding ACT domain protein